MKMFSDMNLDNYKRYAPAFARYGVGIVFLIFGIWQFVEPSSWEGYLPAFVISNFNAATFIYFNGAFDSLIGILLISGAFVRVAAALGALHLLGIVFSLGWNDAAVRDIGLLIVLIAVFLNGKDELCLGKNKNKL